jgi:hypothetical protein
MTITVIIAERSFDTQQAPTVSPAITTAAIPLIDSAVIDSAIIPALGEVVISKKVMIGKTAKGRVVYLRFSQTADDTDFKVLSCVLNGVVKRTRYT